MIFQLARDFRDTLAAMPAQHIKRVALARLLQALDTESHRIARFPLTALQQIHNSLLPFQGLPAVSDVRGGCRLALENRGASWVELKRVVGPGQSAWGSGFSTKKTEFPDQVEWFAVLPKGRILALTCRFGRDNIRMWMTNAENLPQPVEMPLPFSISNARNRRDRIASLGPVVAVIDAQKTLRFYEAQKHNVRLIGETIADASGVVAWRKGFIAMREDGALFRFSTQGQLEAATEGLGLEECSALAVSDDGKCAALVKASKETSLLRVVDLEESIVRSHQEVPWLIFTAGATGIERTFLLGGMHGSFLWAEPWIDTPKKLDADSVREITLDPAGRFAARIGGRVIINDFLKGLVCSAPAPPGDVLPKQTVWSTEGKEAAFHVAGGKEIHTHYVRDMQWARDLSMQSIERGLFDRDGKHFVGVGGAGHQFLWDTETGHLLDSYMSGHTYMPYGETHMPHIEWAPSHARGAVCHIDEVEILDARAEVECSIDEPNDVPAAAAWDDEGKTLAYACSFSPDVRVVAFAEKDRSMERYSCEEPHVPRAWR